MDSAGKALIEPEASGRHYSAYGMGIHSALPLPELSDREAAVPAQVGICAGQVARQLEGRSTGHRLFVVAPGKFMLHMEGVARYLVSGGNRITIDSAPGADETSIRLFLFGSVFGVLLHQRGLLPLHASAIETPKGAVLFAGGSGTGKSALAAAFHARGYRVIADEICALDCGSAVARVFPAIPRLLLWPDVIEQLGLSGGKILPARANLKKYHVPLETGFAVASSPIHALYVLRVTNTPAFNIARISGLDKFDQLTDLTFRRQFLSGMADGNGHFQRVTSLARDVRMWRLERPFSRPLEATADWLERDFVR